MSSQETLLPCPFCGWQAALTPSKKHAFCTNPLCQIIMPSENNETAMAAWNRRVPDALAVSGVIEAARNAVGIRQDGMASFQPECNGSAQDLLDALAALDRLSEGK